MIEVIDWFSSNKEWVFSGIGAVIIAAIITWFFRRSQSKKQIQKSGNNSVNIQVGDNLNIHTKETEDERSQKK